MITIHQWMRDECERRKDLIRRFWAGSAVEHVPIDVRVRCNPNGFSTRAQFLDGDKQLEVELASALASWELARYSDAIPALRPDVGCSCLASAFGAEYYWGDNEEQTPGIRQHSLVDLESQVDLLPLPDPQVDGWLPEGLRRIRRFAEAGEGFLPVSLLDAAGGMNVAADLLGVTELLISLYTAPEAVHRLLDKIQTLFLALIREGIRAAGGVEHITTTDFPDYWFPEGHKGHVSDDICAQYGPEIFREFSAPYNARVYQEFGAGGLHNCGPNPCHAAYLDSSNPPRSLDLSARYSSADLPLLKSTLKGKAFIYLVWDTDESPVDWYRGVMDIMAPDVAVVPVVALTPADDPGEVSHQLKIVAEEYAARMDWGWR